MTTVHVCQHSHHLKRSGCKVLELVSEWAPQVLIVGPHSGRKNKMECEVQMKIKLRISMWGERKKILMQWLMRASLRSNPTSQCALPLAPSGAFQQHPCSVLPSFDLAFPLRCSGNSWKKGGGDGKVVTWKKRKKKGGRNKQLGRDVWVWCNVLLSVHWPSEWASGAFIPISKWRRYFGHWILINLALRKSWVEQRTAILWAFLQSRPSSSSPPRSWPIIDILSSSSWLLHRVTSWVLLLVFSTVSMHMSPLLCRCKMPGRGPQAPGVIHPFTRMRWGGRRADRLLVFGCHLAHFTIQLWCIFGAKISCSAPLSSQVYWHWGQIKS